MNNIFNIQRDKMLKFKISNLKIKRKTEVSFVIRRKKKIKSVICANNTSELHSRSLDIMDGANHRSSSR